MVGRWRECGFDSGIKGGVVDGGVKSEEYSSLHNQLE